MIVIYLSIYFLNSTWPTKPLILLLGSASWSLFLLALCWILSSAKLEAIVSFTIGIYVLSGLPFVLECPVLFTLAGAVISLCFSRPYHLKILLPFVTIELRIILFYFFIEKGFVYYKAEWMVFLWCLYHISITKISYELCPSRCEVHYMFSQAFGQQTGASDDFQEFCSEEKGVKKKFSMDAALEDKICDLYDLFVDVQICPFSALSWKKCFPLWWRDLFLFDLILYGSRGWMKMRVHKLGSYMQR